MEVVLIAIAMSWFLLVTSFGVDWMTEVDCEVKHNVQDCRWVLEPVLKQSKEAESGGES